MKYLTILFLCVCCSFIRVSAQCEEDFAAKFTQLYDAGSALSCKTISPVMMLKMMQENSADKSGDLDNLFKDLKSVRIISNKNKKTTKALYEKALRLIQNNQQRYTLYDEYEGKHVYMRKKKKIVLELVLITMQQGFLRIVDLTGNMPIQFVKSLTGSQGCNASN